MAILDKTFAFASTVEGFISQGSFTQSQSGGQLLYTGTETAPALPQTRASWIGTYEDLGVPAGSTITAVEMLSYKIGTDTGATDLDVDPGFNFHTGGNPLSGILFTVALYTSIGTLPTLATNTGNGSHAVSHASTQQVMFISTDGWAPPVLGFKVAFDDIAVRITYTTGGGTVGSAHVVLGGGL